jgi:hypothetical protein
MHPVYGFRTSLFSERVFFRIPGPVAAAEKTEKMGISPLPVVNREIYFWCLIGSCWYHSLFNFLFIGSWKAATY